MKKSKNGKKTKKMKKRKIMEKFQNFSKDKYSYSQPRTNTNIHFITNLCQVTVSWPYIKNLCLRFYVPGKMEVGADNLIQLEFRFPLL